MNWISLYNINLFPFGTKQSHCPFSKLYNEKKDIILFSSRIHNINFILTCYLKVINGEVYDFRCYFCKSLPRVGSANRSELYRWEEFYVCFHNQVSLGKPIKNYRKKLHPLCEVRGGGQQNVLCEPHNKGFLRLTRVKTDVFWSFRFVLPKNIWN